MHRNRKIYDLTIFRRLVNLARSIYYGEKNRQDEDEMESLLSSLNNYNAQNKTKMKNKKETFYNANKLFYGREIVINAFENGIFPLPKEPQDEEWSKEQKQTDRKSDKKKSAKDNVKEFSDSIAYKEMGIDRELFKEYFNFQKLNFMLRDLIHTNDKKKNNALVSVTKSWLKDLKYEVKKISENQIATKKTGKV